MNYKKYILTMHKYRLEHFALGITIGVCVYQYCKYKNSQKNQREARKLLKYLLIGSVGVGKTKLFTKFYNSISKKNQADQNNTEFKEFPLTNDIALVDTPSINFESSIDLRETLISQFTQYMMNNQIQHFFLVVNFERTDLMKKKILEVLKYFKKFKEIITVVVSNFQLSENEENDTNSLRKELKVFLNQQQSIIFVRDDFKIDQLRNEFLQHANAFSLKETIFEPSNEHESQQIMELIAFKVNEQMKGNHQKLLPNKENKKIEEQFNQKFHNYNSKENEAHQIEQQQEQTEQQDQSQLFQQQQQKQQNIQEVNNDVKDVAQNQLGQQEQIQKEHLNQSKNNVQNLDLEDKSTLSDG